MGSKNEPGEFDCYANALPDEPMFILLVRDPAAPEIVEQWAKDRMTAIRRGRKPMADIATVAEAELCAKSMRKWRKENDGKWRAPK